MIKLFSKKKDAKNIKSTDIIPRFQKILDTLSTEIEELDKHKGLAADDFHEDLCYDVDQRIEKVRKTSLLFAQKDAWLYANVIEHLNKALNKKKLSEKQKEIQISIDKINAKLRLNKAA